MSHEDPTMWQNIVDYWPAALVTGCVSIGTYVVRTVLTNQGSIKALEESLKKDRSDIKEVKTDVKELGVWLRDHFAHGKRED